MTRIKSIAPGGTIGMLGGGQLGRMTALAAARLGYRTHVFSHEPGGPCAQVSAMETVADYRDRDKLAAFAESCDVVTLEWENIPIETVEFLTQRVPVHPGARLLSIAQDRVAEKSFVNGLGIGTAEWRAVSSPEELRAAAAALGTPAVLKSSRLGYDGKGQVRIMPETDLRAAWATMGADHGILEAHVAFETEISVIVARGPDGAMATYPAVENIHVDHILDRTVAPADIPVQTAAAADRIARTIAEASDLVGVLAVEMFVTPSPDGLGGAVLVNEIAPRPHNSGHWTIDACAVSQFELQVRAVCGLPLGDTTRHADAEMRNLIGDAVDAWPKLIAEPGTRLHLYGKSEARPGRKMGHVTRLKPRMTS